ncbi:MAG: DUF3575 domain-containing protein, partial [Duncaniella sp.]|nr:DUF3575 domain-containing protein [Duncaniella sp.]
LGWARDFLGYHFSRLQHERFQGWMTGVGVGYGYSWLLNRHWSIEAELAVGFIHANYDIYECQGCGKRTGKDHKNFFAPTKAAVNIVYVF